LLAVDCEWRKEAAYWKDHLFHLKRVESHVLAADQTGNHISGRSVHRQIRIEIELSPKVLDLVPSCST
jgi:hypothetical protein